MNWDYCCKFDHEMIDYDSNNIQNRAWHNFLKYKASYGEVIKSEMVKLTWSCIAPVALNSNTIECFFEEMLIH